jgi:hypothetical protein
MGNRRDRIVAAARYIGAASGIPNIEVVGYGVKAPFPYSIRMHTGRVLARWLADAEDLTQANVQMLVWYRGGLHDSAADALVTMRASTAAELLAAHYEAARERRKGGE